jgi:hypothetical protein
MGAPTCTQALRQAYASALAKLPADTHARLGKALTLVQQGGVTDVGQGYWEVSSQSEGAAPHSVNGSCNCDWAHFHPNQYCTHQLAVMLTKKSLKLMTPAPQPIAVPQEPLEAPRSALGEAPASCNVRLIIGPHEVQWTLRGHDEAEVFTRLQKLLSRRDVSPIPKPQPRKPSGGQHGPWKQRQGR